MRRWRGRHAEHPNQIPGPGWLDVVWRVKAQLSEDRVSMLAAGIAFHALLSLFPAIGAVVSLWALAFDPAEMARQIGELSRFMPAGGARLIHEQAQAVSENTDTGLSLAAIAGLLLAMLLASRGVGGLMVGLSVVYGEVDRRGLVQRMLVTAALTFGLIVVSLVATMFVALYPMVVAWFLLDGPLVTLVKWLRWPALLPLMMLVIAVLYRYGPYRRSPRWEWVGLGTVTATLLWLLGSAALSLYVGQVADMDELYGSLGAVVVLMLWFWLSAYVVLLGAEINAEMERQTRHDTTVGEPRPMGERGAYAADTLGPKRPWRRIRHQGEDL
ncbi:YihY/virulence factor BrkB family protein [Billgrantia antri]|uniref:YihY/virulence factor BrkB family protein n=1 Tax=Billgrantia antri TaxID=2846777 RepID=A0ABS6ZTH0_9GAMM|nr:YihY/virulence factor BrkB family protein [Halomonas antri]MBW6393344.1 YihY/virulence factor BrkB family protein [Halomonas antri]